MKSEQNWLRRSRLKMLMDGRTDACTHARTTDEK